MALVSEISLKPCMAEDEMQGDFYADQYLEQYTYENMEDDIEKGYDFIIVARNRAVGKTQSQIQGDIRFAMRKLGLIK